MLPPLCEVHPKELPSLARSLVVFSIFLLALVVAYAVLRRFPRLHASDTLVFYMEPLNAKRARPRDEQQSQAA